MGYSEKICDRGKAWGIAGFQAAGMMGFILATFGMVLLNALPSFAATYDISKGDIVIIASSAGQTVTVGSGSPVRDDDPSVTGTSDANTLTIDTEPEQTANVTLNGLKIDVSAVANAAAVRTIGEGDVRLELDGDSSSLSGSDAAGLQEEVPGFPGE